MPSVKLDEFTPEDVALMWKHRIEGERTKKVSPEAHAWVRYIAYRYSPCAIAKMQAVVQDLASKQ